MFLKLKISNKINKELISGDVVRLLLVTLLKKSTFFPNALLSSYYRFINRCLTLIRPGFLRVVLSRVVGGEGQVDPSSYFKKN